MRGTSGTRPRPVGRRGVSYDPATSTLVVGAKSVVVTCNATDNECLLRTYLDLVAQQRHVPVDTAIHLRRGDIVVLAQLLDLDDEALEARLQRMLRLSERHAAALARQLRRNRVAAALGLGVLTAVPAMETLLVSDQAAAASTTPIAVVEESPSTTVATVPTTVETVPTTDAAPPTTITVTVPAPAPAPEAAPAVASAPAPAPVDVGYAVRYERDPAFVPPPGVDIGDAMMIERDAPPPEG